MEIRIHNLPSPHVRSDLGVFLNDFFSDGEQQLLSIGGRSYGKSRRVMLFGGVLVCPSSIYSSQTAIWLIENTFYI